jgi:hypothetical protein
MMFLIIVRVYYNLYMLLHIIFAKIVTVQLYVNLVYTRTYESLLHLAFDSPDYSSRYKFPRTTNKNHLQIDTRLSIITLGRYREVSARSKNDAVNRGTSGDPQGRNRSDAGRRTKEGA